MTPDPDGSPGVLPPELGRDPASPLAPFEKLGMGHDDVRWTSREARKRR